MEEILNKEELKIHLLRAIDEFNSLIESLDKDKFESQPGGKWSPGQDLKHLVKVNRIFGIIFTIPLFLLHFRYGRANRGSRSPTVLKSKYAEKSNKGGIKAPSYALPGEIHFEEKPRLIHGHHASGAYLIKRLSRYSETELDLYIMGHPLFGKVTLREMFMIIFMHIDHHKELLRKKLGITA
jgi:hypothetical protein